MLRKNQQRVLGTSLMYAGKHILLLSHSIHTAVNRAVPVPTTNCERQAWALLLPNNLISHQAGLSNGPWCDAFRPQERTRLVACFVAEN